MDSKTLDSFESVNERLKEIIRLVGDDSISLDEALALFEEAAVLGVKASAMLEENILAHDENESKASDDTAGA